MDSFSESLSVLYAAISTRYFSGNCTHRSVQLTPHFSSVDAFNGLFVQNDDSTVIWRPSIVIVLRLFSCGSQLSLVCMWVHVNMCSHRNVHCCPSKPSEHESQTHWQNFGQRFRVVVFTIDMNKRQLWKEIERYSVDYFGNMVMKPRKSISFQHNDVLGISLHFVLEQMNWSNQTLHILIFIRCVDNFVSNLFALQNSIQKRMDS